MAKRITESTLPFSQHDLEDFLSILYSPTNQAAMVTERYSVTPYIQDYKIIIQEAVQAHFLGLDHVAVAGLMPVIEGAGKKLAESRSVPFTSITSVFENLADDCKKDAIKNNIGAVGEVISMMESFADFAEKHLYVNSGKYSLTDNTNRHGILHGAYSDEDYGTPINFYKCIASIDFLCFVSAFRAAISWLAPSPTEESNRLAQFYSRCLCFDRVRYTKE